MDTSISRRRFVTLLGLGLAGSAALAACGGSDGSQSGNSAAPVAGSGAEITLALGSAGDDSKFDKEKLEAPAGSKITLKFTNNSKPEANKQFNWVLTKPDQMLKVVNDGLMEGETNGFIKPNDENVIANTKLLKAGESDSITFDAPAPGEYPYICTNPGYYARMRGTLVIK